MTQSQLEQHQPLKSSASTHIKRLFIRVPLFTGVGIGTRGDGGTSEKNRRGR
jgi:hypothetical protein